MSDELLVCIIPEELTFGNVCVGFTYRLTVTLLNTASRPQRFKVNCKARLFKSTKSSELPKYNAVKAIYDSSAVAPGLSTIVYLEMFAEHVGTSKFEMKVAQSLSSREIKVGVIAHVLPLDSFKCISQALAAKKESIYSPGVRPIPQPVPSSSASKGNSPPASPSIAGSESPSTPNVDRPNTMNPTQLRTLPSAASLITESLLEESDIEEILLLPMQFNQYWDPFEMQLKSDPILSKICVHETWSIEDSQRTTYAARNARCSELENLGMYTIRTIGRMRQDRDIRLGLVQPPSPQPVVVQRAHSEDSYVF